MRMSRPISVLALLCTASLCSAQTGGGLYGIMFRTGGQTSGLNPILYDINTSTGTATNPRSVNVNDCVGITVDPTTGIMYGMTDQFGRINNLSGQGGKGLLFTINPATGLATAVGRIDPTGVFQMLEGDIAVNPTDGVMWGVTTLINSARLFTIDKSTGLATQGSAILPFYNGATDLDISALAFSPTGALYVLDTRYPNNPGPAILEQIELGSGAIVQYWNTGVNLGNVAGMSFRADGTLFIADGDTSGTNHLYRFDFSTGTLVDVGATGAAGGVYQGLSGLAFGCGPAITQQPASTITCATGTVDLLVAATGGTLAYRWQIETTPGNWINANDGGLPYNGGTIVASGTGTAQMHLVCDVLPGAPAIRFRCLVSNTCAPSGVASNAVTVTFCPADFNCSGVLNVQDIFDYLAAWFAGTSTADFNHAGGITVQDIFDFLAAWFTGC